MAGFNACVNPRRGGNDDRYIESKFALERRILLGLPYRTCQSVQNCAEWVKMPGRLDYENSILWLSFLWNEPTANPPPLCLPGLPGPGHRRGLAQSSRLSGSAASTDSRSALCPGVAYICEFLFCFKTSSMISWAPLCSGVACLTGFSFSFTDAMRDSEAFLHLAPGTKKGTRLGACCPFLSRDLPPTAGNWACEP